MKTQRSTNWVLGLVMLTTTLPLAAQNTPQQTPSLAGAVSPVSITAAGVLQPGTPAITPEPTAPRLSPWTREIAKLAQSGIEDEVVFSFIENCGTFNLGADQIIHLKSVGVSGDLITAMLQHDFDLASGVRAMTTTTLPPMDPALEKMLVSHSPPPQPTPAPAPSPTPREEVPETDPLQSESPPSLALSIPPKAENAITPTAATCQFTTPLKQPAPKPASLYRVPETRSVQLVPPILVYAGSSPTPNLLVIEMFPSSR